ncbi:MAG: OadG family protein [Candidatus Thiodiazotropha sp. (ex Lucinoma kastoroae)]|nr:OadG family protein [Candidatus Thiodiazotropha sp.]MCU7802456.1 OadG family protein [Candidatus Thiodiazotropha sp. (ex Lucinoma borealis)]MCU7815648.1 OadG family protein [Candidatus Thiodiazotropha sp. (ex Rostrolucina anterorostrata)]MCU7841293.1 OadG family protein [Candidatus Thiodiazotropha sp. (ex Troendleina suluensis)]MCU7849255.1 OadG family protein [Candidatus Thiodiazotropha sp. (ex Lucinoma kastoroae)]MCU7883732.1 OadG family protein [Candidatus Thiodiazotropha sp. (ex Lucinom
MPITDLLMSGVNLMGIGMTIVFTFLLVLVFAMKGMSKLALFVTERQGVSETLSSHPLTTGQGQAGMRGDLVAVITAAINTYRTTHQ